MAAVITFSPLIIIGLGGWRLAYFVQGGLMGLHLLVWSMLALVRPSTPVSQPAVAASPLPSVSGGSAPARALLTYPHAWLLGVVMLCLSASWTTVLTFLPTILEEERGVAISSGGILFGFLYYALIPGGFFGSKVFRNITNRRMMVLLPAMGNTVFTFAALLAGNTVIAALALTGLGLVWVFVSAMEVLPFEFNNVNEREVSVLAALVLTLGAVGFGAGPVLAGSVAQITGSLMTGVFSVAAANGFGNCRGGVLPPIPWRSCLALPYLDVRCVIVPGWGVIPSDPNRRPRRQTPPADRTGIVRPHDQQRKPAHRAGRCRRLGDSAQPADVRRGAASDGSGLRHRQHAGSGARH